MKVLISVGSWGGAGGTERAAWCVTRALSDCEIEIVYKDRNSWQWNTAPETAKLRNVRSLRWRGSQPYQRSGPKRTFIGIANQVRRRTTHRFDLHYSFHNTPDLRAATGARVALLNPCGDPSTEAAGYEYFALEAPDNAALVPRHASAIVLPPPYYPLDEPTADMQVPSLPAEYLLTVFNPRHAIKGTEELWDTACQSTIPIVWCHSERMYGGDYSPKLKYHPNIVHVVNPSPSLITFLYRRARAYVCFSQREGFGWAIADAMHNGIPIISRRVGIMSFDEHLPENAYIIPRKWSIDWDRLYDLEPISNPNVSWLDPRIFRRRVELIVAGDSAESEQSSAHP